VNEKCCIINGNELCRLSEGGAKGNENRQRPELLSGRLYRI